MTDDELLLQKRLTELAEKAYSRGTYTFTPFLSLAEQEVLARTERYSAHVPHDTFGGVEGAERIMVRFGREELCGWEEPFPIQCIRMEPLNQKFADKLTHRDFLGALMNLGIDRAQLGDIIVREDAAWLFATEKIAPFVCDNLFRARHTELRCTVTEAPPSGELFTLEPMECLVASERIDGVLSHVYHLSRSDAAELFRAGKVFLNSRTVSSGSTVLKSGDIVSLRGTGRFRYQGPQRTTKSGKLSVVVELYR